MAHRVIVEIVLIIGLLALLLLIVGVATLAERNYHHLPELSSVNLDPVHHNMMTPLRHSPSLLAERGLGGEVNTGNLSNPAPPLLSVDIIVPARNESAVIGRAGRSLVALDYPAFRLTVVDDASTDDTATIAQKSGSSVLRLTGDPPPGWTGKCNACDKAVRETSGQNAAKWLLFTDADTYHEPASLRRAVAYAEQNHLDALSLLLRQECGTLWEKVTLPLAYQNYFATLQPDQAAFNGQYILIRRTVYERSGGFAAVRGRVMEDVALAHLLAQQGYTIEFINGSTAASVRMYQGYAALLRGMTKTAFAAAHDRGWQGFLMALPSFFGVWLVPLIIVGLLTHNFAVALLALLVFIVTALSLIPWLRRFEVGAGYTLLHPVGMAIMVAVGFVSTMRTLSGQGVRWKGRTVIEHRTEHSQG